MKLIFTPNHEYIHKVLVVAHEANILEKINLKIQHSGAKKKIYP